MHQVRFLKCLTRSTKVSLGAMWNSWFPGTGMQLRSNGDFSTCEASYQLQNSLQANAKQWCSPTTVVASHHYLTHPPLAETPIRWSWLVVVCLGAGWVTPRLPWDDGSRHGWELRLALILLVYCVLFYVDPISVFAENRLRSIINDNFF